MTENHCAKSRRLVLLAAVAGAVCLAGARVGADMIQLKNGQTIHGHLHREQGRYAIQPDHGPPVYVPLSDVVSVTLATKARAAGALPWREVRSRIHGLADTGKIVSILNVYIKTHPKSPNLKAASEARLRFQKYKIAGWRKVGGHWLSPVKLASFRETARATARKALRQYDAGRIKAALHLADTAIKYAPDDATANAVAGLAHFRLNRSVLARHDFAKLAKLKPESAVAWNNLGVIN